MEYLLKASAVVAIFFMCYKVFLQRETFFESNRWYLLLGLVASFLIPFIVIPIYTEYTPVTLPNFSINEQISTKNIEKPYSIIDYLPIVYGFGVMFFLIRFFIQLISLTSLIYKNNGFKKEEFIFIETKNDTSPFSFFKWIVYNPKKFNQKELEQIITHEKVHAKQYHSIDILLTQLSCIVLWFNPFIWLYNNELKQNLEFIADGETQRKFNCKKSYQTTLLKTSMSYHQMALSNHFHNSLIKKRIVMLQKSKSKKINLIKYAFIVPLLAFFLLSFNTEEVYLEKINDSNHSEEIQSLNGYKVFITKDLTNTDIDKIIKQASNKGVTLKFSKIKRNADNEIIQISVEYKNAKGGSGSYNRYAEEGKPIKSFYYYQDERGFGFKTAANMNDIEVIGYAENDTLTSWKTTNRIGKSSDSIQITTMSSIVNKSPWKVSAGIKLSNGDNQIVDKNTIYIIDGKESTQKQMEDLNPDDIEKIESLKGEPVTRKYGEKAKGGVIEITTKKKK